jgi:RNA polymerase sigma-70 factor, ECF subfamily
MGIGNRKPPGCFSRSERRPGGLGYSRFPISENYRTLSAGIVSMNSKPMPRAAIARDELVPLDERALIARILDGDRVAGRQLYEAHATRVHRLVYRLCGDAELAQDFTQDTFVRAFDQLSRFRGEAAFGTWIHRIAVTVTLNGMRKVKRLRERETTLDEEAGIGTVSHRADPDLRSRIAAAIDALPEGTRLTLIMHDIEGYTHAEIAESLGIAEGTSKSRLFDARGKLRLALAAFVKE